MTITSRLIEAYVKCPTKAGSGSVVCMTITSRLIEAYVKCPTKCFLQARAETGVGNAYADWVNAQNASYQREEIGRLREGVAIDQCFIGPLDRNALKSGKWYLATEIGRA